MRVHIMSATPDQAGLVQGIVRAAFAEYGDHWDVPFAALSETFGDVVRAIQQGGALLAWIEQEPVGSARFRITAAGKFIIERVAVLPSYQGNGIAGAMLAHLENIALDSGCHTLELTTRLALPRVMGLYRKHGYEIEAFESETGRVLMSKLLVSTAVLVS